MLFPYQFVNRKTWTFTITAKSGIEFGFIIILAIPSYSTINLSADLALGIRALCDSTHPGNYLRIPIHNQQNNLENRLRLWLGDQRRRQLTRYLSFRSLTQCVNDSPFCIDGLWYIFNNRSIQGRSN